MTLKKSPPRPLFLFLILMGSFFCAGCTSQGFGDMAGAHAVGVSRTVYIVPNTEERAVEYMPELAAALRQRGFTVSPNPSAPYRVSVTFAGGGFDLSCSIVMTDRGMPLASGKGVNPSWGVWMARDRAYSGVFRGALREFSKRIH